MAVANGWATGHTCVPPVPQLRPSSPPSLSSSSSPSSSCVVNFTKKPFLRPPLRQSKKMLLCCCTGSHNNNNCYSNSDAKSNCASPAAEWDWNRWTRHFSEVEQAENFASVLKFQLEEAIEKEDFHEAAKLKKAIVEATSKDSVGQIMSQLQSAIHDERYHDASRICQSTGSGLVGWWVGYSKDSDDPFGRVVRITPGMGRFVGRSYSPRQLITASPGTPLFEIFVVKDDDDSYTMQVVYLQQTKGSKTTRSLSSDSKPMKGQSAAELENSSVVDVVNDNEAEKEEKRSIVVEGSAEEGIKSIINFLKDKIPELKVKVTIKVTEELTEDGESVKQLMEDNKGNTISSDNTEEQDSDLDNVKPDELSAEGESEVESESDSDSVEDEKDQDMKLFIGAVLHNKEDNPTKDDCVRVPADIADMESDSFVLQIPKRPGRDYKEDIDVNVHVSAVTTQGISELMPPDVAKAFLSPNKISPKVSRNMREVIELAVKQAQKQSTLSEYTNFSRIITSTGDLDPFEGLYVGAFGPYGTEIVQLRRRYGNWNVETTDDSASVEFYEYVEAVKLTGDLNVPAGQVTFRAKIGRGNRSTSRGMYPDELGVLSSYKGQGRIAEFGYQNPRWVEGELLQLNGKGLGPYVKGAGLGFLYVIPDQSFLVLFNRLKLPE